MATDALVTQGAKASSTMVLTKLSQKHSPKMFLFFVNARHTNDDNIWSVAETDTSSNLTYGEPIVVPREELQIGSWSDE